MMKMGSVVLIVLSLLMVCLQAQPLGSENPHELWVQANYALKQKDFSGALTLYNKVLEYCQENRNVSGTANALEAIALIYKKQDRYSVAGAYCRKAIRTGAPTYRSYYLLAQIAYDADRNHGKAKMLCKDGLKVFPQNTQLKYYLRLIEERERKSSSSEAKKASVAYLSNLEEQVIRELNLARGHPQQYADYLEDLKRNFSGVLLKIPGKIPVRTFEGLPAVDEAIRFLRRARPLPELKVSRGMSKAAKDHVADQSRSGDTGHAGGDGSEPFERIERYGNWQGISGENIAYGDDDPRMIVMQLIIDDGVASRGHRANIFNKEFRIAGVGFGSHPVYRNMCVITFASGYKEKIKSKK